MVIGGYQIPVGVRTKGFNILNQTLHVLNLVVPFANIFTVMVCDSDF